MTAIIAMLIGAYLLLYAAFTNTSPLAQIRAAFAGSGHPKAKAKH